MALRVQCDVRRDQRQRQKFRPICRSYREKGEKRRFPRAAALGWDDLYMQPHQVLLRVGQGTRATDQN